MTTQLSGTIIKTPDSSPGLLVVGGQQKTFTLEGVWKSPVAPAVNMAVDIELDGAGFITGLRVVDPQQAVREKLGHIGGAAQEHGKDAADKARRGVNALAARMGKVALISTVILWIAWFFMPGLSFSVSFFGAGQSKSFTLWDALALDPGNNMNPGSHGFLSLVVIAGIVAPIAASFIRRPYARYLYAAPLACLLVAWFTIQHEIDQVLAASGLAADLAAFKMSPDYGAFIIALASLVVAARVLKLQATDNAGSPASTPTGRVPFLVDRFCTECGKELSPGENLCAECRDGRQRSAAAV